MVFETICLDNSNSKTITETVVWPISISGQSIAWSIPINKQSPKPIAKTKIQLKHSLLNQS